MNKQQKSEINRVCKEILELHKKLQEIKKKNNKNNKNNGGN